MSRIVKLSVLLVALAVALPVLADDDEPGMLARAYTLKVKSGHQAEFEAGVKKQIEWYEKNNETWHWHLWQLETGEDIGNYVFRSPSHTWADLDARTERGSEARAHFMEHVSPHLDSISGAIGEILPDLSHWPEDIPMVPMVSVYEFSLHYGMVEDFIHTIGKIHEAIQETDWPVDYAWGVTVSGGEVGTMWLVIPLQSWADMKGPDKPFNAMLEEALGRADADAVMVSMRKCVRESHNFVARLRTDLSYMPSQ
jgi:hypothetical protein